MSGRGPGGTTTTTTAGSRPSTAGTAPRAATPSATTTSSASSRPGQPARSTQPARASGNTTAAPRAPTPKAGATPSATAGAKTAAATSSSSSSAATPARAAAPPPPPPPAAKKTGTATPAAAKATAATSSAAKPSPTRTSAATTGVKSPAPRPAATKTPSPPSSSTPTKTAQKTSATARGGTTSRNSSPAPKGKSTARSSPASAAAAATAEAEKKTEEEEEEKAARLAQEEAARQMKEEEERLAAEALLPKIDPQVVELRNTLAERRKKVNELEVATQCLALLTKVKNATERADSFQDKSTSITADIRKMKKEIDTVRHADRALGNLKDTLDSLQKHLRMRRAHIRQKRATIVLMEQRSKEYAKNRKEMVFALGDINRDALELARAYEAAEVFSATVDPYAALKTLVEIDNEREKQLVASIRKEGVYEASQKATVKRVILAQKELAMAVNKAADETAVDLAEALSAWDVQRVSLEKNIAHREKAFDEVQHHLHRGTNFLWTSQMQRADLRPIRELKLACDQHSAKLVTVEQDVRDLAKSVQDEETNITRDVEEINSKMADTANAEEALRSANERLRKEYVECQAQYPLLSTTPLLPIGSEPSASKNSPPNSSRRATATAAAGSGARGSSPVRSLAAVVAGTDAQAAGGRQPRRSQSEEIFHGPSWMRPTAARRMVEKQSAAERLEQQERSKDFRSRKPGNALAKAQMANSVQ